MSTNLINQIRELSKQLAHARSVWGDEDERTWELEDQLNDLEDQLADETESEYENTRVGY